MESVNLLSLDGGGVRGVCELLILHEIMNRIQFRLKLSEPPRPCDYFHLIGGTSTGGLIALMLGRLRMTTNEALIAYNSIAEAIFGKKNQKSIQKDGIFKATTLETKFKEIIAMKELGEHMLQDTSDTMDSKAFVCAVPADNLAHPRLFRTYKVQQNGNYNGMIWEAARATTAAPPLFKRIAIGEPGRTKEEFLDGGLRFNNPAYQVIYEARSIFGDTPKLGCLVSIGTGHPGVIGLSKPDAFQRLLPLNLIGLLKRIATDCEETAHKLAQKFQDIPDCYFRYSVTHGAGNISLEEWEKMAELETHTKSYMQDVSVSKSIDAVVKILCQSKIGNASANAFRITLRSLCVTVPESGIESVSQVSIKRQHMSSRIFTGRTDILGILEDYFEARGPGSHLRREFLLHGIGGGGKTQIALNFAEKNRSRFEKIFWMDASNKDTLEQSYKSIASKIDTTLDSKSSLEVALQRLEAFESEWLIIFDGADDIESISSLWPPGCQGNVLYTSRNHMLRRLSRDSIYEVNEMSESDAVALLLAAARLDHSKETYHKEALAIVKELGFLALAIDQAGAYIANGQCSIQDFLTTFQFHRQEMMKQDAYEGASNYDKAVYTIWELSYMAISRSAGVIEGTTSDKGAIAALQILNIFTFFHNENIMEDIFKFAAENPDNYILYDSTTDPNYELLDVPYLHYQYLQESLFPIRPDGKWDSQIFRQGIRILLSYSLIRQDKSSRCFSLHRLVHTWCFDTLTQEEKQSLQLLCQGILAGSIYTGYSTENSRFRRDLLPHITALRRLSASLTLTGTAGEMSRLSLVYHEAGNWGEAEKLTVQMLKTTTRLLKPEDHSITTSMCNLVAIYLGQGRWEEAEKLHIESIEPRTRELGPENHHTLLSLSNLAFAYLGQGRWKEAEKLYIELVEKTTRVLGPEDPNTLTNMGNLASAYSEQGRWREAEELEIQLVETNTRIQGPEHPTTLASMNNLATTYSRQNRHEEAEKLQIKTTRARKIAMGPEHPQTLISMNNLASFYADQKRWEEAERLLVEVVNTRTKVMGADHLDTLSSMLLLAVAHFNQGRLEKAEELGSQVSEARMRLLGSEHPSTIDSQKTSLFLSVQNRRKMVEKLHLQVVKAKRREVEPDHVRALINIDGAIKAILLLGLRNQAVETLRQVVEIYTKVLGIKHPSSLASMNYLAYVLMLPSVDS